jgi:hypothetical protein
MTRIQDLSPDDRARLVDDAKRRAALLRAQAVDEFWSAVGSALPQWWSRVAHALQNRSTPNALQRK